MNYFPFVFRNLESVNKQEIWRQKQLDIFYRSGKPIFTMDEHTQHLRSHNNPYFYKDKEELKKSLILTNYKKYKENI